MTIQNTSLGCGVHIKIKHLYGIRLSKNIADTIKVPHSNAENSIHNKEFQQVLPGLRPMVKLIGNIHGNEPVGRELLMHFASYILNSDHLPNELRDERAKRASRILETTDLWILPSMNPDGFEESVLGLCRGSIGNLSTNLIQVVPLYHTYGFLILQDLSTLF